MSAEASGRPSSRLWQPATIRWFVAIFGASTVYSVVRYHFAGDVAWTHFPLFILNKATALAAVLFLASSYLIGKVIRWYDSDKQLRLVVIKFCGLVGFFLAAIHAFMSVVLMRPAYFAKYFLADGRLDLQGELGITTGTAALFLLLGPAVTTLPMMARAIGGRRWKRSQRLGYVALGFVAGHLMALGLEGWLVPSQWPGGLPPISSIAFVAALTPLVVRRHLTRERDQRRAQRRSSPSA